MFGIEEYYSNLLTEAKSPEEIKKILEYQFVQGKGIPQEFLNDIFEIDPTKKKSYTKWALLQWDKYNREIAESLNNGKLQKLFNYFKTRADSGLNLTAIDFESAMKMMPDEDPIFAKEGDGPENDFDIVYDSPEWKIAVPHTYEADKKLGQGCRWCTAGAFGDSDSYWNRYSQCGPLWVNFDKRSKEICPMDKKEYPYKRYQFLFEWNDGIGELKDCRDDDVLITANDINIPEEVIEFYREQNESYADRIENDREESWEERSERYWSWRDEHSVVVINWNNHYLELLPEENDNYEINENCDYYLYDTDWDYSDPITYDYSFNPEDFIEDDCQGYPLAILKPSSYSESDFVVAYASFGRHNWEIIKNVNSYGTVYSYYYVLADNLMYLFAVDGLDGDYAFSFDEADKVIPPKISQNIYSLGDWSNGEWFEIISDGKHSLYFLNYENGYEFEEIISSDIPAYGDNFIIEADNNGELFVQGKYFRHSLSEDKRMNLISTIDDNYAIVQIGKNSVNIWNSNEKELVFPHNFISIQETEIDDFIQAKWENGTAIFNYKTKKQVTDTFLTLEKVKTLYLGFKEDSGKLATIYNASQNFACIGTFTVKDDNGQICFKPLYDRYFLYYRDGKFECKDLVTNEIKLSGTNYTKYGDFNKYINADHYIVFSDSTQSRYDYWDLETNKIVFSSSILKMPKFLGGYKGKGMWVVTSDNKNQHILWNDEILFKNGIQEVKKCGFDSILYKENGKLYFSNISTGLNPLPSKAGIDTALIENLLNVGDGTVKIGFNKPWPFMAYFDIPHNKITNIIPLTNEYCDKDECLKAAKSIFYPEMTLVSESFKNTYKKIINIDSELWD